MQVTLAVFLFSAEAGVKGMLLKMRLLLRSAKTCVRLFSTLLRLVISIQLPEICEFLCFTLLSLYLNLIRGCILVHYSTCRALVTWLHKAGLIIFTLVITQPIRTKENQRLTIT